MESRNLTTKVKLMEYKGMEDLRLYFPNIIQDALFLDGVSADIDLINCVLNDKLDCAEDCTSILNILHTKYALQLVLSQVQTNAYDLTFYHMSGLVMMLLPDEMSMGTHIPLKYANNLLEYGNTITKELNTIKSLEGKASPIEIANRLITLMCEKEWFVSANTTIGYLMALGYLLMKTSKYPRITHDGEECAYDELHEKIQSMNLFN